MRPFLLRNQALWVIIVPTKGCCSPSGSTRTESLSAAAADLWHLLRAILGRDQEGGTLCSGRTGRVVLQICRYLWEKTVCTQRLTSSHTLKSAKTINQDIYSLCPAATCYWAMSLITGTLHRLCIYWLPPFISWEPLSEFSGRLFPGL